jgi:hypothetical protein
VLADSIDVLLPAQRVREMHAVRGATADGMPDTTKFRTTEHDRLTGDTIVAHFDTVATRDTAGKPKIRELIAIGHATSLQHLAPRDTACRLPAVNYVRGRLITVHFDSAKVSTVTVKDPTDQSGGVYIEPSAGCKGTQIAAPAAAGTRPAAGAPAAPATPGAPRPATATPARPAPADSTPTRRPR